VPPAGTVVRICVGDVTVRFDTVVPLNSTFVASVKLAPLITTLAPGAPPVD